MPTPRPGAGEVVVTTLFSGISGGTERLIYRGEFPQGLALDDTIDALGGSFRYPFPYGYACVGEVEDWDRPVFAFQPHQDVFTARPGNLISLPAVDPASATLFPPVETALQVTLDAGAGISRPRHRARRRRPRAADRSSLATFGPAAFVRRTVGVAARVGH